MQIVTVLKSRSHAGQVLAIDVGGDIALDSRDQHAREISDAGADFEYPFTQVRAYSVAHPAIETRRFRKRVQDVRTRVLVNVVSERITQDDIHGLERIFEPDLLSFLVGAPVVTDGRLVDPDLALRGFDSQFRLYAEATAAERDAFEQRCAEGLIARLHVGEV